MATINQVRLLVLVAAIVASIITVLVLYGYTGKSIVLIIVLLLLMLCIENLPKASSAWRLARVGAYSGLLIGWCVVLYVLGHP